MIDADATDEQLIARFARGERGAFESLARRHEAALLGLAHGVLGARRDLACDAVQETWLRVVRYAASFNGRSSFKTWLYRIAINQCRSVYAAHPSRSETSAAAGSAEDGRSAMGGSALETRPGPNAPSVQPAPDDAAEARDRRAALRAAVAGLPTDQRVVLLLCYHGGMTHPQAAEILEIPLGTLKSRLHAALEQLRGRLSPEDES